MYVLITSGGRNGVQLANLLVEKGHTVKVIEYRDAVLAKMHQELPTECIVHGNPTDPALLRQLKAETAGVVVTNSPLDTENLVVCSLIKKQFTGPKTIAIIKNPRLAWLYDDKFNVDVVLDQLKILGGVVHEEMSMSDLVTLLNLRLGNFQILEKKITEEKSSLLGKPLKDIELPSQLIFIAVFRGDAFIFPKGNTELLLGDSILVLTDKDGKDKLAELLKNGSK